jgi:hypothetical protein
MVEPAKESHEFRLYVSVSEAGGAAPMLTLYWDTAIKSKSLIDPFLYELILAFWFGPSTAVKFGPLGRHWLGFMDGATEA